jgi:UTP--glucose-1-phosphate uridylyltransferase
MKPRKALITAANPAEQHLPLQTITDALGVSKSVLENSLDELFGAGIESVAIVIVPGSADAYQAACGSHADAITFIEQASPRGYGHAVWCARDFIDGENFVLLVGDHLFMSNTEDSCVKQLLDLASGHEGYFSAVQVTDESQLHLYGTIGAVRDPSNTSIFEVSTIIEKPTPTLAEQELIIPGLRHGKYLCFFGIQVLKPSILDLLGAQFAELPDGARLELTPALAEMAQSEQFLATELKGTRFNLAERHGLLRAQIALALAGPHRDDMLVSLIELISNSK